MSSKQSKQLTTRIRHPTWDQAFALIVDERLRTERVLLSSVIFVLNYYKAVLKTMQTRATGPKHSVKEVLREVRDILNEMNTLKKALETAIAADMKGENLTYSNTEMDAIASSVLKAVNELARDGVTLLSMLPQINISA